MVIDFHTHIFPDALAPRAMSTLSSFAEGVVPCHDGTAAGLRRLMADCGIDRSVVCNIASKPSHTKRVNDFALSLTGDPVLTPLGSIHPDCDRETIRFEIERLKAGGIRGVKIHPDYMEHEIDDPAFLSLLADCRDAGMFVVTHAGFDYRTPSHMCARPEGIRRVLDQLPGLTLVAAHLGGHRCERETLRYLAGSPVWLDLSLLSVWHPDTAVVREIFLRHDTDRLLFGSDAPWGRPDEELSLVCDLFPDPDAQRSILYDNAAGLLGLPC